jgi:flagellar biosynthesis anti-sigma factor FlgM
MVIRNSLEGLNSLFGTSSTASVGAAINTGATSNTSVLNSDSATLSSAASQMSQSAAEDGVRLDKVSTVQSALLAGTYQVSSAEVASKVVDAMLVSA